MIVASISVCFFCRDRCSPKAHHGPWDEAWTIKIFGQCSRPDRPREELRFWILHAWLYTYPWHPWRNDPLTFKLRSLVLFVNIGLTFVISNLFAKYYSNFMTNGSDLKHLSVSINGMSVIAVSGIATGIEAIIRAGALSIFRTGLRCVREQPSFGMKMAGVVSAVVVSTLGVLLPMVQAAYGNTCNGLYNLVWTFFFSELLKTPICLVTFGLLYIILQRVGDPESQTNTVDNSSFTSSNSCGFNIDGVEGEVPQIS